MPENENQEKLYFAALVVWGIFFIGVYALLARQTAPPLGLRIFNSPDETANYYFTRQWTERTSLRLAEPLNTPFGPVVYPRASSVSEQGDILPGSFLGLIIVYGLIAKFFGSWIIVYLTPLIAYFGALYWFKLLKIIFNSKIAFTATLLLWLFPGWWYYNSRSMFHNVLFVTLAIFAFYFLALFFKQRRNSTLLLAVLFLVLAVFVRFSEVLWLCLMFFCLLVYQKNTVVDWRKKISGLAVFLLALAGLAWLQLAVFHHGLTGAYTVPGVSVPLSARVGQVIFPFGLHFLSVLKNGYFYIFYFFWWYAIPAVIGLILALLAYRRLQAAQRAYLLCFLGSSLFLLLYYGSWKIQDHIGPGLATLDTSYVRYWLPLYVMGLPFVAFGLQKFLQALPTGSVRSAAKVMVAAVFIYSSYQVVYASPGDGIRAGRESIFQYYRNRQAVMQIIPADAIILSDRSDKVFFPTFPVISDLHNPEVVKRAASLLGTRKPLYFYSHLEPGDINDYTEWLRGYGLNLEDRQEIWSNEYLYTVVPYLPVTP